MVKEGRSTRFLARRQLRIDARRGEILTAAARVFAEKGYANATTKEIADGSNIAEGTLYNYFANKREILFAIANETEAPMEGLLHAAEQLQDRAALVALVEQMLDIAPLQLAFMRTTLAEAWVDDHILTEFAAIRLRRVHRELVALISERIANGEFRPVEPELAAQMLIGMFTAVILPMVRGISPAPGPERRRVIAEAFIGLLLDGVRAERP